MQKVVNVTESRHWLVKDTSEPAVNSSRPAADSRPRPGGPVKPSDVNPSAPGHQAQNREQDDRADDGGDPGAEVEEAVQALDVEQHLGQEATEQRTHDTDDG